MRARAGPEKELFAPKPETRRPHPLLVDRGYEAARFQRHSDVTGSPAGERLIQCFALEQLHRARSPQYFELAVEHQEGLQQVLFGPEAQVIQHRIPDPKSSHTSYRSDVTQPRCSPYPELYRPRS